MCGSTVNPDIYRHSVLQPNPCVPCPCSCGNCKACGAYIGHVPGANYCPYCGAYQKEFDFTVTCSTNQG